MAIAYIAFANIVYFRRQIVYQMRFIKFLAKFLRTLELARGELLGMGFFFVAILLYYGQLGYLVSRPDAAQRHAVLRAVYTRFKAAQCFSLFEHTCFFKRCVAILTISLII